MTRSEEEILRLAGEVSNLDNRQKQLFINALMEWLSVREREMWFGWTCCALYPQSKWDKVDRWMEGQFRKDMSRKPYVVASMCVTYLKINPKMKPFLIKKAQRVKNRVYMRNKRAGKSDNVW